MPYFVGYRVNAHVAGISQYFGRGVDFRSIPPAERPAHQLIAFLKDPANAVNFAGAAQLPIVHIGLQAKRSKLPDVLLGVENGADRMISDRVKRIFESFEPDRHFFFRVEIHNPDGASWPEPYWLFKAGPSAICQAMIVEQSPALLWVPMETPYGPFTRQMRILDVTRTPRLVMDHHHKSSKGITLDSAAFVGRHILSEEILRQTRIFFFSDEIVSSLKAIGGASFIFGKVNMEVRQVPPYGPSNGMGAVA